MSLSSFQELTSALRVLSADMVEAAQSGHPGLPLGMADVVTVLFRDFLHFDPKNPQWVDRDRFVLSAGHGCALLYALLYLTGYERPTLEDLKNFRSLGSPTAGHPEYGHLPGVETTTGPLGQGLGNAVGMALAQKKNQSDRRVYVLVSDGDLMEGVAYEAMSFAGHLKLSNLIVLFDDNGITIDGKTSLTISENTILRVEAQNWVVKSVDGHDESAIQTALAWANQSDRPVLLAFKTTIGKGAPSKEGTHHCHGSPLGSAEIKGLRSALNWPYAPFEIPEPIRKAWACMGKKSARQMDLTDVFPQPNLEVFYHDLKKAFAIERPHQATRQLSQRVLSAFLPHIPQAIGGSADLTPSNNTQTKEHTVLDASNFAGNYVHYGIREHAMGAVMNGLCLSGFIPYSGTFLTFSDYMRPPIRLSSLMNQGVIYVFTHDSIGLGEDGPTHQPIEHLAALRAIPNLLVFRPADAYEVVESWKIAFETRHRPSAIVLTRQNVPFIDRETNTFDTYRGGYILRKASCEPKVTLISTGSEISLSLNVQARLEELGIPTSVTSLPCWRLFDEQDKTYQEDVLGAGLRVGIEAASSMGWHRYIGREGMFFGMTGFGASGKASDLFQHFNLTPEFIVQSVRKHLA